MSKTETKTDKILSNYSFNLPTFMFVVAPILGPILGGLARVIFADYIENNQGTFVADYLLNYAPLILPIVLSLGPYLLYFILELVLSVFESKKENEDKNTQLVLIFITIIVALAVFLVNIITWPTEFWQDVTKYGNNGGITGIVIDLLQFAKEHLKTILILLSVNIISSVGLAIVLKIGKGKNFKRFTRLVAKLELLSLISMVVWFFFNCFIYTPFTVLMFCCSFALSFVLLPTFIKVIKDTCPFCYKYYCGKTLLSVETITYEDHTDMRIVSSTDYKYEGDNTTYRVNTYAPAQKEETRITLKCNSCGKISQGHTKGVFNFFF